MNITYSGLVERVGHYLFGIRSGFSADQTSDITDCIRDGLQRVYAAHDWSFLRPVVEISAVAPYATGTIVVSSGVVTLTGGTFPAWAAKGILKVNSRYYSVATRDSDTQVTLNSTGVTVSDAANYTLACPEIDMPAAFEAIDNDAEIHCLPTESQWYPPIRPRGDQWMRRMEQASPEFGRPVFYSVRTVEFDPTVGSRRVIALNPIPDEAYLMRAKIVLRPVAVDAVNEHPIGGELLSRVILEACLAAAEHNFEEREHVHEKRFMEDIAVAIRNDQVRSSPASLGPDAPRGVSGKFSVFDYDYHWREQRIGRLTLDGEEL